MLARTSLLALLVCCVVGRIGRKVHKHSYIYHPYQHFHHRPHHAFYLRRTLPYFDRVRKGEIIKGSKVSHKEFTNETAHQASKRGFLANLATLLNDADNLAKKSPDSTDKNRTVSNTPLPQTQSLAATANSSPVRQTESRVATAKSYAAMPTKPTEESVGQPVVKSAVKPLSEPTPSVLAVEKSLVAEGKNSAPIFALFHGKIVPLGRLPDSSFKKTHTEKLDDNTKSTNARDTVTEKNPDEADPIVKSPTETSPVKEETGNRKSETVEMPRSDKDTKIPHQTDQTAEENRAPDSVIEKKRDKGLNSHKYNRLLSYLNNLGDHSNEKPTAAIRTVKTITKDVRGTTKDQVSFPDPPSLKHPDLLSHVKGLVLDSGKVVSLWNHQLDELNGKSSEDEGVTAGVRKDSETSPSDADKLVSDEQKTETDDESELANLVKSKERIEDLVKSKEKLEEGTARDTTPPLSVSVDTLKDLLKKTDSKASLAELLNNRASGTNAREAKQEEDPGTIEDFAAGGLKAHNEDRALHHSPPLIWSDDLAAEAQKLAEELADSKTLRISKDLEKKGYGENVAKVWANFKTAGEAATKMWYSQNVNYHFDDPHLDENTGQFAQVIWKDTKEIGMGVAKSVDDINNKYVYVTALYRPPGNIEATLRDNVLPTGNNTVDVYSTFFKRSGTVKMKSVLSPRHANAID